MKCITKLYYLPTPTHSKFDQNKIKSEKES